MKKLLLACLLVSFQFLGQAQDFYGNISSVTLSDTREFHLSDYTITSSGVIDANAGGPNSNSYLPVGTSIYVYAPTGTNFSTVTTITITTPTNTATLSTYLTSSPFFSDLEISLPFALNRAESISLTVRNVTNPTINALCGSSNTYYGSAPCDQAILIGAYNISGTANIWDHTGHNRYTITPANFVVSELVVEKPYVGLSAMAGTPQNELTLLRIHVKGSTGSFPVVEEVLAALTGTAFMSRAEMWFTGSKKTFHVSGETMLYSENLPSGSFHATPLSVTLAKGDNYIWIVGDLFCLSTSVGNSIGAEVSSVKISGVNYFPTNPVGSRTIGNLPIPQTNLVSNPGFETYSSCPTTYTGSMIPLNNEIAKATGWNYLNSGVFIGTSDYFHSCASGTLVDVPSNSFTGHQVPHGGNGYAGLGFNGFFEYLTTNLSTPLIKDTVYVLSFYAVSAEGNFYKSNGLGAYLSNGLPVHANLNSPVPVSPQVKMSPILYDENEWVFVCDTFVAAGGENWLTIGGFETNSAALTFRPNSAYNSYALIDDVTLVKRSQTSPTCTSVALELEGYEGFENHSDSNLPLLVTLGEREFALQHFENIQSVELYTISGTKLGFTKTQENVLYFGDHAAGLYLLRVATKENLQVFRIVLP